MEITKATYEKSRIGKFFKGSKLRHFWRLERANGAAQEIELLDSVKSNKIRV